MYHTHCITSLAELSEAQSRGLLADWGALMTGDPTASFFQGPAWCTEWYRCYDDVFQPLLVSVTSRDVLVGLIPLAVERSTRRLTFASDEMADYRDVAAIPEHRAAVVAELLRICRAGRFSSPLQLGPMQPESETLRIALGLSGSSSRVQLIARSHSSWRWWFSDIEAVKKLTSKKSVRQPLSHYKRQGPVVLERIETSEAWDRIREVFFSQHSVRQLYTERPVSFNNPRKQAFYDALIRKYPSSMHVTALRVAERMLAMHYGYVWKNVLYWGAPAFDITEDRHSPGQVLLALVFQSAAADGLRGVDLTLGIEEYKKRFSNEHVELPTLEVYSRPRQYYVRRVRDGAVSATKASMVRLWSPQAWERVRDVCASLVTVARGLGKFDVRSEPVLRATNAILRYTRVLIFAAKAGDMTDSAPSLASGESCALGRNRVADLLKWPNDDRQTARKIAESVKKAPELMRSGHMLHTLLLNDHLVGWGWSYLPQGHMSVLETQTLVEVEPRSVALYGFHSLPKFHGRPLFQAFVARVLRERFTEGTEQAYIVSAGRGTLSRRGLERIGVRLIRTDKLVSFLGRERRATSDRLAI